MIKMASGFLLASTIVLQVTHSAEPTLPWVETIDGATAQAAATGKPILMHFWTETCRPCKELEDRVFSLPLVIEAVESQFIPVKVNANEFLEVADQYGVKSVPTDVAITADGEVLRAFKSPSTPEQYITALEGRETAAIQSSPSDLVSPSNNPADVQLLQEILEVMGNAMSAGLNSQAPNRLPSHEDNSVGPPPDMPSLGTQSRNLGDTHTEVATTSASFNGSTNGPHVIKVTVTLELPSDMLANQDSDEEPTLKKSEIGMFLPTVPPAPSAIAVSGPQLDTAESTAPIGLDGYCPVCLTREMIWRKGNEKYGAIYRGRTYLFVSEVLQREFLRSPDGYAPALSGDDVVLAAQTGERTLGNRRYGFFFRGRVYCFTTPENMLCFQHNPQRFADFARAIEALPQLHGNESTKDSSKE